MESPSNRYDEMADAIEEFLTEHEIERHAKGVPDRIIERLRAGDFEKALATLNWDCDKIGNWELYEFLKSTLSQ